MDSKEKDNYGCAVLVIPVIIMLVVVFALCNVKSDYQIEQEILISYFMDTKEIYPRQIVMERVGEYLILIDYNNDTKWVRFPMCYADFWEETAINCTGIRYDSKITKPVMRNENGSFTIYLPDNTTIDTKPYREGKGDSRVPNITIE